MDDLGLGVKNKEDPSCIPLHLTPYDNNIYLFHPTKAYFD